MISQLEGNVQHIDERYLILDVHGVGYKVAASMETIEKAAALPQPVRFWTYLVVRENALDLYGFLLKEELDFFEMLISISGIGPKTALSILNIASINTLRRAVSSGDSTYLTKVSGIGKKNAEKIVMELKDKLENLEETETPSLQHETDSLEALKSLGYPERDARDALKKISKDVTTASERIKQALKILGGTR